MCEEPVFVYSRNLCESDINDERAREREHAERRADVRGGICEGESEGETTGMEGTNDEREKREKGERNWSRIAV